MGRQVITRFEILLKREEILLNSISVIMSYVSFKKFTKQTAFNTRELKYSVIGY